jgi:hypothetical protein
MVLLVRWSPLVMLFSLIGPTYQDSSKYKLISKVGPNGQIFISHSFKSRYISNRIETKFIK